MLQPSKKAIQSVKDAEQKRISDMYKVSVNALDMVKKYTDNLLPKIAKAKRPNKYYKQIEDYLTAQYGVLFTQYKEDILNALNQSGVEQLHLIEATLGQPPALITPIVLYKTLPKTPAFEVTNHILSTKSVLKRSKTLAYNTTKLIADSFDKGLSVQETSKKLDILFGFRDKEGKIMPENLKLIKEGKLVLKNGATYDNYRICRTEISKMAKVQAQEVFDSVEDDRKRLKYVGTNDKRSRPNSKSMNGQISDKKGRFKYPNNTVRKIFESDPQYLIMCRCSAVTIFLD